MVDFRHSSLHHDPSATPFADVASLLPHHAGAALRIVELFDQACDVLLIAPGQDGVGHRLRERQILYALGRPVRLYSGRRHSPDLLCVRLEEDAVETPTEASGNPALERRLIRWGADLCPGVRQKAAHCFNQPQPLQSVEGAQRIVKHVAVIVDTAHARTEQEILRSEYLLPELLDSPHLGEEATTSDVKSPTIAQDSSGKAADDFVGFEHRWTKASFGQFIGGRQAGGAGPGGPRHKRMKMRSSHTLSTRLPSSIRSKAAEVTPTAHRRSEGRLRR